MSDQYWIDDDYTPQPLVGLTTKEKRLFAKILAAEKAQGMVGGAPVEKPFDARGMLKNVMEGVGGYLDDPGRLRDVAERNAAIISFSRMPGDQSLDPDREDALRWARSGGPQQVIDAAHNAWDFMAGDPLEDLAIGIRGIGGSLTRSTKDTVRDLGIGALGASAFIPGPGKAAKPLLAKPLLAQLANTFGNEKLLLFEKLAAGIPKPGLPGPEVKRRAVLLGIGDKAADDYRLAELYSQPNVTPDQLRQHVKANPLEIQDIVKGGSRRGPLVADELAPYVWDYHGNRRADHWVLEFQPPDVGDVQQPMRSYTIRPNYSVIPGNKSVVTSYQVFDENGRRYGTQLSSPQAAQRAAHEDILERFGGAFGMPITGSPTRWANKPSLNTPGGTNPREILGGAVDSPEMEELKALRAKEDYIDPLGKRDYVLNAADNARINELELIELDAIDFMYHGGHYDEPHYYSLRVWDHTDIDGKTMGFSDEFQSDWAQAWKKWDKDRIEAEKAGKAFNTPPPPTMPFQKTWQQLAYKRLVKEGIETGKDRIGFTTGITQVDRYVSEDIASAIREGIDDLGPEKYRELLQDSKKLRKSIVEWGAAARRFGGNSRQSLTDDARGMLSQWRARKNKMINRAVGELVFYDKILPDYARKFGKRYNAKVGKTELSQLINPPPVWYMDITPEMIKDFNEGGFKLYSQAKGMSQFA
jgi:hypothetical protein